MNVPIIYSPHKIGLKKNSLDFLFVPLSLSSVVKSNPNTDIYFLNVNENYPITVPGVNDVDVTGFYKKSCGPIRDSYKHLSTNQPEFELFCMERFFVLKDFMISNSIESAFLVETDVLIFENLNDFLSVKDGIDKDSVFLSEKKCISLGYVTLKYLEYYCQYIIDCYCDPEKFGKIDGFYKSYREKGGMGGICDMTFCDYINKGMFGAKKEFSSKNMSAVYSNQFGEEMLFDSFIGRDFILERDDKFIMAESYIDNKKIKNVKFSEGRPYVTDETGTKIRLASLHCQGNAKGLMADYFVRGF